jgi:hypothetical protein
VVIYRKMPPSELAPYYAQKSSRAQ